MPAVRGRAARASCPSCGARFPSAFQVECEECGEPVRDPELFGTKIRKTRQVGAGPCNAACGGELQNIVPTMPAKRIRVTVSSSVISRL